MAKHHQRTRALLDVVHLDSVAMGKTVLELGHLKTSARMAASIL